MKNLVKYTLKSLGGVALSLGILVGACALGGFGALFLSASTVETAEAAAPKAKAPVQAVKTASVNWQEPNWEFPSSEPQDESRSQTVAMR